MRTRPIRMRRMNRLGSAGVQVVDPQFQIVSIEDDGFGNPLMTTVAPHGLVGGETIAVTGNSEATYNITWPTIEAPLSDTTIQLATPGGDPLPTGTGGTWSLL